jgi:hypothetical protein
MSAPSLPPVGPDLRVWAQALTRALLRGLVRLNFLGQGDTPSENGIILWDDANGYPVVSKDGEFRQIVLEDGHYNGSITADVTAAAADTAYALTYTSTLSDGITNGTPASRIVFAEAGYYQVSFSAQISSTSASDVKFYFWPRLNGVDVAGATMINTLHNNGASVVTSRTAAFEISAGDYLEAMWAVDSTAGFLEAASATAFAPAAPASTISIVRLHG